MSRRTRVLYIAPWVDFGGTDKGTIDWFRWMDRDRFSLSLITTNLSPNRRLAEVADYADEVWALPDLMPGPRMPEFILDFVMGRRIEVVHVMNSRLGFELLPDLDALPGRPRLVVQLHVEEADRSGYVRYVTTRFGNLVDAFSVTSRHLAEAVVGYGVLRERVHVVSTGVDAEEEFSPARVRPRELAGAGRFEILYPGRLVAQKDPLLMVDVVDRLRRRRTDFRVHAVGEGDLEPAVRAELAARGLERFVELSPPTNRLHEWYAACDALLMTSVFEGVPYVLYEAMAMGLPAVVPALPGNVELAPDALAELIDPRDDAQAYADALERLVADPDRAAAIGERAREHVRRHHTLAGMADAHGELYDRLAGDRPPEAPAEAPAAAPPPLRFRARPSRGRPRVSVVVPCFNHGRWLEECLASVRAQTYPDVETIVVDDGSTDPDTREVLDRLADAADLTLIRLERNSGPSAARNRAIDACTGRYVLPLDADNQLVPDALAKLVGQLQLAGETVGFVYQNLQHFGNREDYFEAPDYNLHTLLRLNYCDTSSLIDREVFDAGIRFDERVVDGHEDWEFFLDLAERGVHGEPARAKTLLFRKHGFSRSERIDHAARLVRDGARRRPDPRVKPRWAPALSVIALSALRDDSPDAHLLPGRLYEQTLSDFELLTAGGREASLDVPPAVRRLPARSTPWQRRDLLEEALRRARGRWLLIGQGTSTELLDRRERIEQVVRLLAGDDPPLAVAFVDLGEGAYDLQPAPLDALESRPVHAIAVGDRGVEVLGDLEPVAGDELGAIATALRLRGAPIEWRHLRAPREWSPSPPAGRRPLRLEPRADAHARLERELRLAAPPALASSAPRREGIFGWEPVHAVPLYRYRRAEDERRVVATGAPPEGFELERVLGFARMSSFAGTRRLVETPAGDYETRPLGDRPARGDVDSTLAYVEQVHFLGLVPLVRARHAGTHQPVLLAGDDPLRGHASGPEEVLGYVEAVPAEPAHRVRGEGWPPLAGLVRAVDMAARRHRYAVGSIPPGTSAWELGAVVGVPVPGGAALHLDGPGLGRAPDARASVGWALAPLAWRGFGRRGARARATARRIVSLPDLLARPDRARPAPEAPAGWLLPEPGPGRLPLYAGVHPVTGDRLLSPYRVEITETGYGEPELLGYMVKAAPTTGTLGRPRIGIPWASRFGEAVRWHLEEER